MKIYRPIIEDSLELCNADGEVVKEIFFTINVNEMYKELIAKYGKLSAQINTEGGAEDKEMTLALVKDLCLSAYGEDVVAQTLDFFKDEESALASLISCYVEKIYPLMIRLRMENLEQRKKMNRYAETADGN